MVLSSCLQNRQPWTSVEHLPLDTWVARKTWHYDNIYIYILYLYFIHIDTVVQCFCSMSFCLILSFKDTVSLAKQKTGTRHGTSYPPMATAWHKTWQIILIGKKFWTDCIQWDASLGWVDKDRGLWPREIKSWKIWVVYTSLDTQIPPQKLVLDVF